MNDNCIPSTKLGFFFSPHQKVYSLQAKQKRDIDCRVTVLKRDSFEPTAHVTPKVVSRIPDRWILMIASVLPSSHVPSCLLWDNQAMKGKKDPKMDQGELYLKSISSSHHNSVWLVS